MLKIQRHKSEQKRTNFQIFIKTHISETIDN